MTKMAGIALGCLLSVGCASIVSKSDWPVNISSSPSGAEVVVQDQDGIVVQQGATPMTVSLPAKAGFFKGARYTMEFSKPGYTQGRTVASAHLNGWYWGNIVFGGLIGMLIVDPATGAMWKLPQHVYGNLRPLGKN